MFEKVFEVFSEALGDTNGPLTHIGDCRRVGKFQSSDGSRPRPVLVTLDFVLTVDRILSKVSSAGHRTVKIRRDLPFQDRLAHSVLMKKRWSLIRLVRRGLLLKCNCSDFLGYLLSGPNMIA